MTNKKKIINDPVHGFIQIPDGLIYDLVSHSYFQRLRHISQMGLSFLVYPGATHHRFSHALGSLHLMQEAIKVLKSKGVDISDQETQSVFIAILLHDIGHGPFSHLLENSIISDLSHEELSLLFMEDLNKEMGGALSQAIEIFQDKYPKKFLHQLVSSQLDMDRLDYLTRDSFYTGVQEGIIGTTRIIEMLNVHDDQLVVDEKGMYSIEKFILSRRMMFWQVYLHKTSAAAELMLKQTLTRAKEIALQDNSLFCTPGFAPFLFNLTNKQNPNILKQFSILDDHDIWSCIKNWRLHPDPVLSFLSEHLIGRKTFATKIQNTPFTKAQTDEIKKQLIEINGWREQDIPHIFCEKTLKNFTYTSEKEKILILKKDQKIYNFSDLSALLTPHFLAQTENKYLITHPKIIKK